METAAITILGGVTIYVVGQIITKLYIEPVHELRMQIGRVADTLLYFAHVYYNVNSDDVPLAARREMSLALRRSAAELAARSEAVMWHPPGIVPSRRAVGDARKNLIGLSNSFGCTYREIDDLRMNVKTALRMRSSF
jgi:hypothetical protein